MWERAVEVDPWQGLRRGFAVVVQDVRGRGDSEGEFVLKRTDGVDGADTVAWVRRQPWSDGRVVMGGSSYSGIVQFLAAAAAPEGLAAIAPTMSGEEREIWFWNGATRLHGLTNWVSMLMREAAAAAEPADRPAFEAYFAASSLGRFHEIVTPGTTANAVASPVLEWFDPTSENEYYETVRIPDDLMLPGLHTTGWYDVSRPATLVGYERMAAASSHPQMLQIGPWAHGNAPVSLDADPPPIALVDALRYQFEFFRYVLGLEGSEPPPAARTYVLGADRWVDHDAWPPPGSITHIWSFAAAQSGVEDGGRLLDGPVEPLHAIDFTYDPHDPVPTLGAAGTAPGRIGPHDQRAIESRADVLTFTTPPQVEGLELCGAVAVVLPVASSAWSTDFVARLTVVKPDGRSLNLIEGYWSGALADLGPSKVDSHLRVCRIELGPLHAAIGPGERLRLHVTSSDYPEIYPNPNTGHLPGLGVPPEVRVALQTLLVGGPGGAELIIEVRP